MALLDIIITHHKEAWRDCRKMFEMLRLQRGVKPEDFRVILVQDGEDEALDMVRLLKVYPFVGLVVSQPAAGVSEARNAGLAAADAEWVMFCDCDDTLYSVDSLFRILESIREAGDRADLLWSDFWIEMKTPDGRFVKTLKGWNSVFIHGKAYRRTFLEDRGIRFDPELNYSEDAMFNAVVAMETDVKRVAKMPETVYMWCYRDGSLSNYTGGDGRRNLDLYKKRLKTIYEYEKRGLNYDADTAAVRTLLDYYWELNGQENCPGRTREEWIRRLREDVIRRRPGCLEKISQRDRTELMRITREEAKGKRLIREGMPAPEDWMREIGAI